MTTTTTAGRDRATAGDGEGLDRRDRRRLALLGLPTLGLALAVTVISTYLPTVAREFTGSNAVIGAIVAAEGVAAILLPVLVGAWSDRLRTPWGGRIPFLVAGTPLAVAGLVCAAVVGSLAGLALACVVFFAGYFIAYEPYRALYADLVDDEAAGRAQSTQAFFRGIGTILALVGGGLLLAAGRGLPFLVAAVVLAALIGTFATLALRDAREHESENGEPVGEAMRTVWEMARDDGGLRAFFVANALWELALAALKTFVVLWLTRGLGIRLSEAALAIGAVAVLILVGAMASGKLADRFGRRRVMSWAVLVFGLPMIVLVATTSKPLIGLAILPIAVGGGVLLSLPYALLQPLMPEDRHGALTGFYSVSRGVGIMLGPLLAGLAVTAGGSVFSSTQGYAATWIVCGLAALASLPVLRRVRDEGPNGDGC